MATEQEKRFRQLSIVVVDEDHGYGNILVQELRTLGIMHAVRAHSPKDALHTLGGQTVDVIITECYPRFGSFLRDKSKNSKSHVPILVVTGEVTPEAIYAARDAGVDEILAKPVSAGILASHIHDAVDDRRPFIEMSAYYGPDRRRHPNANYDGAERRGAR
jgi:two-component system chemotaxis response regulator CheY